MGIVKALSLSGLFNATVAIVFGLIVIVNNRRHWTFLLITFSTALWSICYWLWLSSQTTGNALFWVRMLSFWSILIPPTYFHWINSLLEKTKEKRKVIITAYLISFIFLLFSFSPFFVKSVERKLFFPFWPTPGPIYGFYLILSYIGLFVYSLFLLIKIYRETPDKILKGQIRYVLFGSIFGLGGGATNFLLWYNIPIPPYGNFLVALYPIIFAYAILKYHLFNAKIILTEFVVFILWVGLLIKLFLAKGWQAISIEGGFLIFLTIFGILLIRSVLREVEQRKRLEILTKNLEAANEKLKQLDKLKSEFLSFTSHQVKSPMTIVKGYATLIADGTLGETSKEVKETAEKIKNSADRMISLVNNLLDLRKIEEGKMDFSFEKINVVELVKKIVEEFKNLAKDKKLELSFELKAPELFAKIDTQKFSQVIQNLIDNAIKYTEKGWVKVSVDLATENLKINNYILITVSDSGRGISKELMPKIFEEFSRDWSFKKEIQGTGLGLYIAKQIVLAHQGEIWVESEGNGKGSRFIVKLPCI